MPAKINRTAPANGHPWEDDDEGRSDQASLTHLAKGAAINFSGSIGKKVILYGYTVVLARLLMPSELGNYFLMATIVTIAGLVATAGMGFGVVRYVSMYVGEGSYRNARRALQTGLRLALPISFAATAVLLFMAPRLADILFDGSSTAMQGLRIFSLAVPFWVAAKLFNATTQGMHYMQYQVYSRDFGEQVSKVALSVAFLLLGAGLIGVVWANVGALCIATALAAFFAFRILPAADPGERETAFPTREMLSYSAPMAGANILNQALLWSDLLLLGYLSTSANVGFYGAAMRLATATTIVLGAFCIVFMPMISDLSNRQELDKLGALFKTVTRWVFTISLPVFLLLVLFAIPIMSVFGSAYVAGSAALALLALGKMFDSASGPIGHMVIMSGHSRLELMNVALTLAINVTLCFLLIPRVGMVGAAVANASGYFVLNFTRAVEIWLLMHIQAYDHGYLKPVAAALVSVAMVFLARWMIPGSEGLFVLIGLALAQVAVYVGCLLLLGLNEQDRMIIGVIKSRMRTMA